MAVSHRFRGRGGRTRALACLAVAGLLVATGAGTAGAGEPAPDTTIAQQVGTNRLISATPDGGSADGRSLASSNSADGRFVAFVSTADDLIEGETGRIAYEQVYVHDRETGITQRVSRSPSGEPGNGHSHSPDITPDGRYVAYATGAMNIVDRVDGSIEDIVRTDLETMTTVRISFTRGGRPLVEGCREPSISADGSRITYSNLAHNIVRHDHNHSSDVFLYDVDKSKTILVSRSIYGGTAEDYSTGGSISADGTVVAFDSGATDIVPGHSTHRDIVIFDVATETNRLLTRGNSTSYNGAISADGTTVVFSSSATNLVPGVPLYSPSQAYVVDVATEGVLLASRGLGGEVANQYAVGSLSISADGSLVTFSSQASNLVPGRSNRHEQVFLRTFRPGLHLITMLTLAPNGRPGNQYSRYGQLSDDGSLVTYTTQATNLVNADTDRMYDVLGYRVS